MQKMRQVRGEVLKKKTVDIRDAKVKNTVVLLKTNKQDRRLVVDLGPAGKVDVDEGNDIAVEGVVTRIGDTQLLVANRVKTNGKTQNIDRQEQKAQAQKNQGGQGGMQKQGGQGGMQGGQQKQGGMQGGQGGMQKQGGQGGMQGGQQKQGGMQKQGGQGGTYDSDE